MELSRSPALLIAESEGLLLDFDGPVCDVYAGSDPAHIAREVAAAFNLDIDTDDPLDLITHALVTGGPVDEIDRALTETEVEAVDSATETPGIREFVERYKGPIAIVSNNATQAIDTWLLEAGLRSSIDIITGRDPRSMKPDPQPLSVSAQAIGIHHDRCIFIGDSLTDAVASLRAGVAFVALANRSSKWIAFKEAHCPAIAESISELVPPV